MPRKNRSEVNPKITLGKPVIRCTCITVELIPRKLSAGAADADLLDAYPSLMRTDIHAALSYAADILAHEETIVEPRRARTGRRPSIGVG